MDLKNDYIRVVPRDLFNEAKLLKCMGRLIVLIEDKMLPETISYLDGGYPFVVAQDQSDGGLVLRNIRVLRTRTTGATFVADKLTFKTKLNSKDSYPLYVQPLTNEDEEIRVFTSLGEPTEEFLEFCKL